MNSFLPKDFFDLLEFKHAALFHNEKLVWNCLKKIKDYLFSLDLGLIEGRVEEGAYLVDPESIFIGTGTVVEAGAYIRGPCWIGENCEIRHGAYIRGNFIAGSGCLIGHATEIKNSIFLNRVKAGHFAYLGDSILGHDVNLGAGTICANLRFDHQNVSIKGQGQRIDTQLKKFGAILADKVQTGCNCVTNPGTIVGKKSFLQPCSTAKGMIPENTIIYSPETQTAART